MTNKTWLKLLAVGWLFMMAEGAFDRDIEKVLVGALGSGVFAAALAVVDEIHSKKVVNVITLIKRDGSSEILHRPLTDAEWAAVRAGSALFDQLAEEARAKMPEVPAPLAVNTRVH